MRDETPERGGVTGFMVDTFRGRTRSLDFPFCVAAGGLKVLRTGDSGNVSNPKAGHAAKVFKKQQSGAD